MPSTSPGAGPWHQALVFSLSGEKHELGTQSAPDLAELERWLRTDDRLEQVRRHAAARRAAGQPWPVPVLAALGLPPAQLSAAQYALRSHLGLLGSVAAPAGERTLTPDELRLLRDVPPHHGT